MRGLGARSAGPRAPFAILALAGLAAPCALAGPPRPHLVRFTSERSELAAGGHLTRDSFTVLTAELAPSGWGAQVEFRIAPGSGEGRAAPAMLSVERATADERGLARTVLLSSDCEETCRVIASIAGDLGSALELRVEFRRVLSERAVVARPDERSQGQAAAAWQGALDPRTAALAAQLADPAVEVRTAVKRMLVSRGREAVVALVEVAGDAKFPPDARSLAVRALAEIGDDEAEEQLSALLAHPLPDVRAGAEEALSHMAADRAEALAAGALAHPEPMVRAAALRVLGRIATERARPPADGPPARLFPPSVLADPDPFVRATAAWEAAHAGGEEAEGVLARALADPSPFVRAVAGKAVLLLGGTGPSREAESPAGELDRALLAALSDARPEVRCAAAKALGLRERTSESALPRLFGDPDARVRRSAALALSWRELRAGSLELLRRLLDDPDALVRRIALRAFAESGTETEMDVLVGMLDLDDAELVGLSIETLRRITCHDFGSDREAWKAWYAAHRGETRENWLAQALELRDSALAAEAGLALARMRSRGATGKAEALEAALVRILRELGGQLGAKALSSRHAAAEALVILGERAGLEALAEDLRNPSPYVRTSALRALGSGLEWWTPGARAALYLEAARTLVEALEDPQPGVRRAAARILHELTGETFGYQAQSPAEHRARAVEEWKKWLKTAPAPAASGSDRREAPPAERR